jgi:tetrahydromethanopterin S-methyltransferase subunit G
MEALLEKEGNVESWNDERLDELSRRMDAGFEKMATKEEMNLRFDAVDKRFDAVDKRFDAVDKRFNSIDAHLLQINDRLDRLGNALLVGAFGVIAALIANTAFG